MRHGRKRGATVRARRMRREPTAAERQAWKILRHLRAEGIHVRRQHPLGPYTVDFAALSGKLLIELDGPVHALFGANDDARDAWLKAEGYRVLRLPNEVALDPDQLIDAVKKALASPSPQGGGGQGAG